MTLDEDPSCPSGTYGLRTLHEVIYLRSLLSPRKRSVESDKGTAAGVCRVSYTRSSRVTRVGIRCTFHWSYGNSSSPEFPVRVERESHRPFRRDPTVTRESEYGVYCPVETLKRLRVIRHFVRIVIEETSLQHSRFIHGPGHSRTLHIPPSLKVRLRMSYFPEVSFLPLSGIGL